MTRFILNDIGVTFNNNDDNSDDSDKRLPISARELEEIEVKVGLHLDYSEITAVNHGKTRLVRMISEDIVIYATIKDKQISNIKVVYR